MPKKIFDIIPPEKIRENLSKEQAVFSKKDISNEDYRDNNREKVEFYSSYNNPPKNKNFLGFAVKFLLIFCLIIVSLGVAFYFFFSEVKIEIWPKKDDLAVAKEITIDTESELESSLWLEKGIIPGEIFESQKSGSKEFSASGKIIKEEKAEGVIRVYNNYSSNSQALSAGTRFVSADGKLFKSVKKITVPGGSYDSKGKFVPGEIDVEVAAAEAGEGYNISPSTFSIPGFAGTAKYTSFYGKSFSDMKGGFKGEASQITQKDLDNAESEMIAKIKEEGKEFLKSTLPEGYILLDEAIFQEVAEKNFSRKAGEEASSFSLEIKVESKAVIFKKSNAEKIAKEFIVLNISEGEKSQEEKMEISYSFKSLGFKEEEAKKDEEKKDSEKNILVKEKKYIKSIVLDMAVKAKIYQDIALDDIKKNVSGKSFNEVRSFLSEYKGISRVKIDPGFLFFRGKMPNDSNKIRVNLILD